MLAQSTEQIAQSEHGPDGYYLLSMNVTNQPGSLIMITLAKLPTAFIFAKVYIGVILEVA